MTRLIHPVAGAIALLVIATFWLSTVVSELLGSPQAVVAVKTTIPWGFLLLVPALLATGGSGLALAKGRREGTVGAKWKRLPVIAANGILVLVPSALFLASKASAGQFDTAFYGVQALELVAGATNLMLLGLSMRDGLRLTQWRRSSILRPAPTRSTSLVSRQEIAKGTVAIHCTRPAGLEFSAGQALYLTLPDSAECDAKGRVRTLSSASAPHDPELVFATRVSNTSFKRGLMALPLGTALQVEGPFGGLALHGDGARPAVFLAGGIGITPFRSIILDATHRDLPHRLFLFYSNRTPEQAAFLAELTELAKRNPRFTLVATITDEGGGQAEWSGERGFITKEMIARYVGDLATPFFYIAGPPAMTAAMQSLLRDAGVEREHVRLEAFSGY